MYFLACRAKILVATTRAQLDEPSTVIGLTEFVYLHTKTLRINVPFQLFYDVGIGFSFPWLNDEHVPYPFTSASPFRPFTAVFLSFQPVLFLWSVIG